MEYAKKNITESKSIFHIRAYGCEENECFRAFYIQNELEV
jgi:hypothetical protein